MYLQVSNDSLAAKVGLTANDFLINIAGKEVYDMTHEQVGEQIDKSCLSSKNIKYGLKHYFWELDLRVSLHWYERDFSHN